MSVPAGERGEGRLEVITKALGLASHTILITKNPNVFKPEYNLAITEDLIHTAKDIYISVWTANNIRVNHDHDNAVERIRLQKHAALQCNNLLAMIQLAQRIFHLPTKRVKYWAGLTLEVRSYIRRWNESDRKRYSSDLRG